MTQMSRQQYSEIAAARVGWRLTVALDDEIKIVWRNLRRSRRLAHSNEIPYIQMRTFYRDLAAAYAMTLRSLLSIRRAGKGLPS